MGSTDAGSTMAVRCECVEKLQQLTVCGGGEAGRG